MYSLWVWYTLKIEVKDSEIGKRVDIVISELTPEFSRSKVQRLIKAKKVLCNSEVISDASKKIIAPCLIEIEDDELEPGYELIPEKIDLNIVYEERIESYCIKASFKKQGDTKVVLEDNNGNKQYYDIHIGKMTYSFKDFD